MEPAFDLCVLHVCVRVWIFVWGVWGVVCGSRAPRAHTHIYIYNVGRPVFCHSGIFWSRDATHASIRRNRPQRVSHVRVRVLACACVCLRVLRVLRVLRMSTSYDDHAIYMQEDRVRPQRPSATPPDLDHDCRSRAWRHHVSRQEDGGCRGLQPSRGYVGRQVQG